MSAIVKDRARAVLGVVLLAVDAALLLNQATDGALWRAVSSRYASALEERRRRIELRRDERAVVFEAYCIAREAVAE